MKNGTKKKVKYQTFAKIIWIAGSVLMVVLAISAFRDLANEKNSYNILTSIKMLIYLGSFATGTVFLFNTVQKKILLISSILYALAAVCGFIFDLSGGSRYAALDMVKMIVNAIVFILFALTIVVFLRYKTSDIYSVCSKIWWLPSLISLILSFIQSIVTELNDSQGFDLSLVIMDVAAAICLLLPMFIMTKVVKKIEEE